MRKLPAVRRRHAKGEKRRGAALVEFALTSPIYLALVLGVVEMGSALEASANMTAALREGGRLASMDWDGIVPDGMTPNEKVDQDIRNFLTAVGLPGEEFSITLTYAEGSSEGQPFDLSDPDNENELFRLTASVPYDEVMAYPSNYLGGQTLTASVVYRAGRISLVQ